MGMGKCSKMREGLSKCQKRIWEMGKKVVMHLPLSAVLTVTEHTYELPVTGTGSVLSIHLTAVGKQDRVEDLYFHCIGGGSHGSGARH